MRVISKFKDYYDGAAVYGVDTSRVYVRERKVIPLKEIGGDILHFVEYPNRISILGFCGEIFPFVDYSDAFRAPKEFVLWEDDLINYTIEKVDWGRGKDRKIKRNKSHSWYARQEVELIKSSSLLKGLFQKYNTPVWMITLVRDLALSYYRALILNPSLKDIAFYKIKDTVTAFQEIEQYISNVLVGDKMPEVILSDKDKRDSKGFDLFSFKRKHHQSKPRRKK